MNNFSLRLTMLDSKNYNLSQKYNFMIAIIRDWMSCSLMEKYLLIIPIVLAFTLATTNVYALQFSFNQSTGESLKPYGFGLPAALIGIASLVGPLLIINERKKAKGI